MFDRRDEDFIIFDVVDTETDDLPVDIERKNWSAEALMQKDEEIANAQSLYKNEVIAGCQKVIERLAI